MTDPVATYFGAERAASLLFIGVACVAFEAAFTCWRKSGTRQARGAAVAMALVAALQLGVGATIFVRSPQDQARVQQAMQGDRAQIRGHELPRMLQVVRNFERYRWIELGLLVVALLVAALARSRSWQRGAALGLAPQVLIVLLFDALAEKRALVYVDWLQQQ